MTVIIDNDIFYSFFSERIYWPVKHSCLYIALYLCNADCKGCISKTGCSCTLFQKANDLTAAISFFIEKDMMPFQIVERPGFFRLMKTAVPHYKVLLRTFFFKTEIPKL